MQIVTRKEAKLLGLKRFFTGVGCVNGHLSERAVCNGQCIICRKKHYDPSDARAYNAAYREENREKLKEYDRVRNDTEAHREGVRRYYYANRDQCLEKARARSKETRQQYYANRKSAFERNPERKIAAEQREREFRARNAVAIRARVSAWVLANRDKARAQRAKRRALKANTIPCWSNELDDLVWPEAADAARRRSIGKVKWHADHMIPLAGKTACGLHVATNCQVIPQPLNNQKRNRMWLTEPLEWLQHL